MLRVVGAVETVLGDSHWLVANTRGYSRLSVSSDCLGSDKVGYHDREVVLNCIIETICPANASGIDLADTADKLTIVDIVWNDSRVWEFFLFNLSDSKSLFQSLCKSAIVKLTSKSTTKNRVIENLFQYFLSIVDRKCHLMESKIPGPVRLSQCLIGSVTDAGQLRTYIDLVMGYFQFGDIDNEQKVFIIEQIAFVCRSSADIGIHNLAIGTIIRIQTRDIMRAGLLEETVKRSSLTAVIACINHSVSIRQLSMGEYLVYLQSIIHIVIDNLKTDAGTFKVALKMFKSLEKYIRDQLECEYDSEEIRAKVFPCFGSVICYLSLFLLSKIDLKEGEESLDILNRIIDWIKQCFQAAHRSIACSQADLDVPRRKRMLSISSLCSEDENEGLKPAESCHWSFFLIDILLKISDEDATLMNEAVGSIVSLMIRTKTLEISGVRYVKNLILSRKGGIFMLGISLIVIH